MSPAARLRLSLGDRGIRVRFSDAAMACIEESGVDVTDDIRSVERGEETRESLLTRCLNGADADREQGWREYVSAVVDAAS